MAQTVCPWWLGYFLVSPLRRLYQPPADILAPYVRPGMTVLEPGPGMGYFTLELARLVGPAGRVVALDLQPKMLAVLERRAAKAGLGSRVQTRVVQPGSLGVDDLAGQVDFALAFAMVHEVPDQAGLFTQLAGALRPGATLLVAEPRGHVDEGAFASTLALAARQGLALRSRPTIRGSLTALLVRAGASA